MGASGVPREGPDHREAEADKSGVHRAATRAGSRKARSRQATRRARGRSRAGRAWSKRGDIRCLARRVDHPRREDGRSPKTLHEYRRKIDKRIRPALGAKRLDKLTAHDLDRFYAAQLATGLGQRTVHHMHRMISAALRQGRKWGWSKLTSRTTPPPRRRSKTELSVPSPVRVSALIREAARPASRSPEMAAVITLAVLTGIAGGNCAGSGGPTWTGGLGRGRTAVGLADLRRHRDQDTEDAPDPTPVTR